MLGLSMKDSAKEVERRVSKFRVTMGKMGKIQRASRGRRMILGRNRIGGVIEDTGFSKKGTVPLTGRDTKMEQEEKQYSFEELLADMRVEVQKDIVAPEMITTLYNQVALSAKQPKVAHKMEEGKAVPCWVEIPTDGEEISADTEEKELGDLMDGLEDNLCKVPYSTLTVIYNQIAGLVGKSQLQQVEGSLDDLHVSEDVAAKWEETGF